MRNTEILNKITKLPKSAQQQVFDLVDLLSQRYSISQERPVENSTNPMLEIAGFAEIGEMDSAEIDKEVYQK